jgi:chromosome segregation protein
MREPGELVRELPVVPKDQLLQSQVPAVTPEGFGYDPQRGELWFAGETAEAVWLELEARRRALSAEVDELEARAAAPIPEDAYSAARDPITVTVARLAARLVETLGGITDDRFEAPLRARADAGSTRTGALAEELRRLGAAEVDARRAAAEAGERLSAIDVERARIEAEVDEARRRLEAAAAEPGEGENREELAERIERLERRRESLGQVNPLAKQEYEQEKERLVELSTQRADLEASLEELETLRDDLARTVEERFAETFASVQANFAEVAATLFPGGEGRLRLTEPEDDDEQPGIEVELRPAGKKVTRLSLLSGGEKALGAISFLFALFLARPCPFYLLDEVEAALDDTNIGRFVELLRRYSDRAQFIVITHQKRTMEAADILYGVTMGADGVSQIVSRRLPREEAAAVA